MDEAEERKMPARLIKANEIAEQIRRGQRKGKCHYSYPWWSRRMAVTMYMMKVLKAAKIAEGR
jgi:hypothetical protein